MSDVILYTTEDGKTQIDPHLKDGTVWLSQQQIADPFKTSKQNISKHAKAIYEDQELDERATVNKQLTVQKEGPREVSRTLTLYKHEWNERHRKTLRLQIPRRPPHRGRTQRRTRTRTPRHRTTIERRRLMTYSKFKVQNSTFSLPCYDPFTAKPGFFITQVVCESMNRCIPSCSWCLSRIAGAGSSEDKIVLVQSRDIQDSEMDGRYTVKRYSSEKKSTLDGWQHQRIILPPDSGHTGYQPIVIIDSKESEFRIIVEYIAAV